MPAKDDVLEMMAAPVEHRYVQVSRLPNLSSGGPTPVAHSLPPPHFPRYRLGPAHDLGQQPTVERRDQGVRLHPQARPGPRKRQPRSQTATQLPAWLAHDSNVHPQRALSSRSRVSFHGVTRNP